MEEDATLELTLIELISSRICHDLVGPVGAVNAGAELMGEDGVSDDEALALMRKSGLEAARRLQLFRLAFGRAGSSADTAAMREAAMLGLGVAMLAVPDVLPQLEDGSLARLAPRWYSDAGAISIYYASRTLLPAKTRAFVDWVAEAFRKQKLAERFAGSIG